MTKFILTVLVASALSAFAQAQDYRIDGPLAFRLYAGLASDETPTYDADSGAITGYYKEDDAMYCWKSVRGTTAYCEPLK